MDFDIEEKDGVQILALEGQVDLHNDENLTEAFQHLIEEHRIRVVIDLTGVSFIDSAGFGALIAAQKKFRTVGGGLFYCNAPRAVAMVVKLSRLQDFFPLHEDVASAEAAARTCSPS